MTYAIESRMSRLTHEQSGRTFFLAFDASFFMGGMKNIPDPGKFISSGIPVQGILAYKGFVQAYMSPSLQIPRIISATASTMLDDPRDKCSIATAASLVSAGADCIGVHLSLGHRNTNKMLMQTGFLIDEAHSLGFPVLLASYVTGIDPFKSPDTVAHAAAIARDLGADFVKISYNGEVESFKKAVKAAYPARVVMAGGGYESNEKAFSLTEAALHAGASGVCFGRAIFEAHNPGFVVEQLATIIHEGDI